MRLLGIGFLGSLLTIAVLPAKAAEAFVFPVFNQGALARLHALPAPSAASQERGGRLQLDWTNEMLLERAGDESMQLDGESLCLAIHQAWDWKGWRLWAELPLLTTTGGVLDSGIEEWHGWFGLPNGGRQRLARDDYHYRYTRGTETVFEVTRTGTRLGDPRLGAATCNAEGRCLNLMVQLPVGDADQLEGGGLGVAGWYEQGFSFGAAKQWQGAMGAGLSVTRADGPLEDQAEPLISFGWLSLAYALSAQLDAGMQLYAHTPLYDDTALDAMSRAGLQLAFGVRYLDARRRSWTVGLQEDLITGSSPDFSIHLGVQWR